MKPALENFRRFLTWPRLLTCAALAGLIFPSALSQSSPQVLYARAGANGDGSSRSNPMGSTAELERRSQANDLIILLASEAPFDGGLALKSGQTLIGLPENNRKPLIQNTNTNRNGGNGIILNQNTRVSGIRIEDTLGSGIFGTNITGATISEVEIVAANKSNSLAPAGTKALGSPIAHGGIVLISAGAKFSAMNHIVRTKITDAAGAGVALLSLAGADCRLVVSDSVVENGAAVGRADAGIAVLAEGASSAVNIDLISSTVRGRLSRSGRNVVIFASADARARARIERSHIGASGQDGIIGIAALIPATVEIDIRDSTIEGAAQTNIEGTVLNLPPIDASRAGQTRIAIQVIDSIIRNAGATTGFENDALGVDNIWIGPSVLTKNPFPTAQYELTVRNSTISGARNHAFGIGNLAGRFGLPPDQSKFEVLLRDNKILTNGSAEITFTAPNARIDARRNCWGTKEGLADDRVLPKENAKRSQLDASDPLLCAEIEKP